MTQSTSKDFTAVGDVSATISRMPGVGATLVITGTFVATLLLESSINNGATWTTRATYTATQTITPLPDHAATAAYTIIYRLRCSAYTSGTASATLATTVGTIKDFTNPGQISALRIDDTGPVSPSKIATVQQAVNVASAAGAAALGFGATLATGLQFFEVEQVVDLTAAGAKFVAMSCVIPAGAIILSAQMNIDTLVVAGGTSVKVGLGLNGGTCNTWGNTADLVKNHKANLLGTTVLAGATTPEVCACATVATGLGDTNFSAGAVRVRIVYLAAVSLPDA